MPLPAFFEPLLCEQYGPELAERIVEGCRARRTTLRANALKATPEDVAACLDEAGIGYERVGWYSDAFVLAADTQLRDVWALPLYEQGALYLQSLSSMLPPLALGPEPGLDVLDMCAAPGGKTTQMAALSGGRAHITACEMHMPRAEKLRFNLDRQGAGCVNVMQVDARRLDDFFRFDQILLDAPCSGSGTLDVADPKLERRFTQQLVSKSQSSQKALLKKALVYSTCSVLAGENEAVVRRALSQANKTGSFELRPIRAFEGAPELPLLPTSLEGAVCVCPTELFEGFFMAKIARLA